MFLPLISLNKWCFIHPTEQARSFEVILDFVPGNFIPSQQPIIDNVLSLLPFWCLLNLFISLSSLFQLHSSPHSLLTDFTAVTSCFVPIARVHIYAEKTLRPWSGAMELVLWLMGDVNVVAVWRRLSWEQWAGGDTCTRTCQPCLSILTQYLIHGWDVINDAEWVKNEYECLIVSETLSTS